MVLARPLGQGSLQLNPLRRACEFVGQRFLRTHATPLWLSLWPFAAMPVIRYAQHNCTRRPWLAQLMGRRPTKAAAVALANKTTRTVWALMISGERYRDPQVIQVDMRPTTWRHRIRNKARLQSR
jgi:hypothetical protein